MKQIRGPISKYDWAILKYGPLITASEYDTLGELPIQNFILDDTLGGFNKNFRSTVLDKLAGKNVNILYNQILHPAIKHNYKNINFIFDAQFHNDFFLIDTEDLSTLVSSYRKLEFKNFICCFNHSGFIGRQFLTSALYKLKLWNLGYCTKFFSATRDTIDGNIVKFCENPSDERYYRKFIIDDSELANKFYNNEIRTNTAFTQTGRLQNLKTQVDKIVESFVMIVSETTCESYQLYYTEKFLYPIISRNLWLAYAQPNYHANMEKYYGFKRYEKIFDYSFDSITDPVARLVAMLTMLLKFEKLTTDEWYDLYLMEKDTIDYNHDQYFSGRYLIELQKFNYGN